MFQIVLKPVSCKMQQHKWDFKLFLQTEKKMKIRNIFTSSWSSRSRRLTCTDSVSFDDLGGDLPSERFPQLKESSLNHSFDASPVHHQSVTRFISI